MVVEGGKEEMKNMVAIGGVLYVRGYESTADSADSGGD